MVYETFGLQSCYCHKNLGLIHVGLWGFIYPSIKEDLSSLDIHNCLHKLLLKKQIIIQTPKLPQWTHNITYLKKMAWLLKLAELMWRRNTKLDVTCIPVHHEPLWLTLSRRNECHKNFVDFLSNLYPFRENGLVIPLQGPSSYTHSFMRSNFHKQVRPFFVIHMDRGKISL